MYTNYHKRSSDRQKWILALGTQNMSPKSQIGQMQTLRVVQQAVHSFILIIYFMFIILYSGYRERERERERERLKMYIQADR